ncbi:MarR family winged helix-turn-helix transcriptional regulator [Tsukamurella strandjordii]|uniref:MarR family transcriptional regulator n=1 Tax=Tsukamurella strandjordii TaxID=147577 RepID=A0AA90NL91_9ACTN|nr:MarR family transcriptional regulator [Tsukamurella strandjordii]MDP0396544.1 MarR family transcriptional regulator [Tsukamurella strandjordii]
MTVKGDIAPAAEAGPESEADEALAAQWHQLMRDYARMSCALDRALSAHDLTSSEFEVLEQLARAGTDGLRMADLAERVHLSQSALSRLVARLERDGLAARSMCSSDRRSVFTTITEEGGRRYADARPTRRSVLRAEVATCRVGEYLCGEENSAN